jgi:hypothetical protein
LVFFSQPNFIFKCLHSLALFRVKKPNFLAKIFKKSLHPSQAYCGGTSAPFTLGNHCNIGGAFWLAVAGTLSCGLASSLAIWAYQSTRSAKFVPNNTLFCFP